MGKPTIQDYDKFIPISACDFAVIFEGYPDLGPMAVNMELASVETERVSVEMYGKKRDWPGRRLSSLELPIQLVLDRRTNTFAQLRAIAKAASEEKTGNFILKPFNVVAIQYDAVGDEIAAHRYSDCWISNLSGYTMDATSEAQAALVTATLAYARSDVLFMSAMPDSSAYIYDAFTGRNVVAGSEDRDGINSPFSHISRGLIGKDPTDTIREIAQLLSLKAGLSLNTVENLRSAVQLGRNLVNNVANTSFDAENTARAVLHGAKNSMSGGSLSDSIRSALNVSKGF